MDLTGIFLDTNTVAAAALIIITGLSVLWGLKKAIKMFSDTSSAGGSSQSAGDRARSSYHVRESYVSQGMPSDHTYRRPRF